MPPKTNYFKCVLCSKNTKPKERATVNKAIRKYLRKKFLTEANEGDVICNKCRHIYKKDKNTLVLPVVKTAERNQSSSTYTRSPPSIQLQFKSTPKTHAYCCICKRSGPKLVVVSLEARTNAFVENNILIPAGNRCCPNHLNNGKLNSEAMSNMPTINEAFVNRTYVSDILKHMRSKLKDNQNKRLNFDDSDSMNDIDYKTITGFTKDQFQDILTYISKYLKNTPVRSIITTVAIFLCKLKSGMSNRFLATLFSISKSSVRRAFHAVRKAFMVEFVPQNLGFNSVSREDVINKHTRPIAQTLFGTIDNNNAIIVLDGTYIYVEKSNHFHFQRRSYSLHKGRPLVKPMIVVATSGHFISALGPYLADSKNNDASILTHMMKTNVEEIRKWVKEDDIFVLDRGFRDALPLLQDLGIQAEMPRFLKKGEKQMSTEDANMSRLVTKVRWVVESSNARIKSWKYLSHTLPTNQIPYIGDYVKIVCALSNKYLPPLSKCSDSDADQAQGAKMLNLAKNSNNLQQYIESENLARKQSPWKKALEMDLHDFPKLEDEELRNITCGVYQMKLASSYIQEYRDEENDIFFHKETPNLLRVKIQSRHTSSKKHQLWIKFNDACIESWYCQCRAGARVVGACSHVSAVLWYLGKELYKDGSSTYGVKNWGDYVTDASDLPPDIIDGSDSDNSDTESTDGVVEE